jgi:hypothetical protein
MHGNFSRADTSNFMAAIGPSFHNRFVDPAPVSNADVGATIAHLLGLKLAKKVDLIGRVLSESLASNSSPPAKVKNFTRVSDPTANGLRTVLQLQIVGDQTYFDAAGFPGRTVGLERISTEANAKSLVNLRREKNRAASPNRLPAYSWGEHESERGCIQDNSSFNQKSGLRTSHGQHCGDTISRSVGSNGDRLRDSVAFSVLSRSESLCLRF